MGYRKWLATLVGVLILIQFAKVEGGRKKRAKAKAPGTVAELIATLAVAKGKEGDRATMKSVFLLGVLGPKGKESVSALRKVIKNSPNTFLSLNAAWALARIEPSHVNEAMGVLLDSVANKSMTVDAKARRNWAVLLIATLGPPARDAVPLLKKVASSDNDPAELEARAALAHIDSGRIEKAVAILEQAWQQTCRKKDLEDLEELAQDLAFFAIISADARRVVVQALKHPNARVRELVADQLAEVIGPAGSEVVAALDGTLSDPNRIVALRAATALLWNDADHAKAIAVLKQALGDANEKIREEALGAVRALALAGIRVQSLTPILRQLAENDPSSGLRQQARSALSAMNKGVSKR